MPFSLNVRNLALASTLLMVLPQHWHHPQFPSPLLFLAHTKDNATVRSRCESHEVTSRVFSTKRDTPCPTHQNCAIQSIDTTVPESSCVVYDRMLTATRRL